MNTQYVKKAVLYIFSFAIAAFTVHAQDNPITWGATENISGDSDVDTNGVLIGTWAPYLEVNTSLTSLTVNGVTFVSNSLSAFSVSNNFTVLTTNMGNPNLPDANYDELLEGEQSTPITGAQVVGGFTFGGLVPGNTYQVQIWVEDVVNQGYRQWENYYETSYSSSPQGNGDTTSAAVTYPSDGSATVGQYCIGTFVPTNTTETVNFDPHSNVGGGTIDNADSAAQVNLVQVRLILLPPTITQQPLGNYYVPSGSNVTITAAASGTPSLSYQWYETNFTAMTGYAITGQTNSSLVLSNLLVSDNYYLMVTNGYGSTNSLAASVVVYTAPLILSQIPVTYTNPFTVYAGANPKFSLTVVGTGSLKYQWFTNGVVDGAATTNTLQMTNVQVGSFSNYCVVTNSSGSSTSIVWTASVIADPVGAGNTGLAPYPQSVLALNPIGYWRMNDTNLDGVDGNDVGSIGSGNGDVGDNGYICHDYVGGNDGLYTNCYLDFPGYNPTADPSDSSAQFGEESESDFGDSLAYAIAGINFGSPTNTSVAFTVEAWVSGFKQTSDAGIVTLGWGGGGEQFDMDCGSDTAPTSHGFRFLIRDVSGATHSVSSTVQPATSGQGPWYHLVGVVDEINNRTVTFYINGVNVDSATVASGLGLLSSTNSLGIGSRMSSQTSNFNDQFLGNINDVAIFNYALNSSQVATEYANAGNIAPFFVPTPPTNASANANATLTVPVTVYGSTSSTAGYQWFDVNGNAIANASGVFANNGSLNATLTVSNVLGSWNKGAVELVVSNAYGTTNMYVTLNINTNLQFVVNIPAQVSVAPNEPYTYSVQAAGPVPLGYEWFSGGTQIPGQSGASYTPPVAGSGSSTFYVAVTNLIGSYTSVVSTLTVTPYPTSAYASNILSLNPAGYWPMHEVEPAAPGDTETNYGTLGLLGTGYWSDWAGNYGAFNRGYMSALAGDSDPSVYFNIAVDDAGGPTNALFVPHISPQSTLNFPFTVECWVFPTAPSGIQGDIWSQSGYEGLNSGNSGGGSGNVEGIRLYWNAPGFELYSYYNSSTVRTVVPPVNCPTDEWYHVVITCDIHTNMILYTNGVMAFTTNATGLYAPDYWTPFEVGNGRGNSRAFAEGAVDEVAVYTNVLPASTIANHYAVGINPTPSTSYFNTVISSNPVIYLRMDSAAYTPPAASTWPTLLNFGTVPVAGEYTPGSIPGLLPGPVHSNGNPINGLSGSNVAGLSGVGTFADAGYAPAYNPVGANGFSIVAMFRGYPCDDRFQNIVGHSDSSWRIAMNSNGHLQCTLGSNSTSVVNSTGVYNDGNWHQVVEVYQPASNPALTGTNALFVDGVLDNGVTTVSTNGIGPGSLLDVMLGSDPQYTNNSPGLGRNFAGQVCEVALFTNALTPTQIVALYGSAGGVGPSGSSIQPLAATDAAGTSTSANFSVSANGTSPFMYQWYFNTASSYSGAAALQNNTNYLNVTGAQLTITNLTIGDSGWYYAILTNNYGMTTSSLASLTVITTNPPPTLQFLSTGTNLTLRWANSPGISYTGWQLQTQTNRLSAGISTNWVNVSGSSNTNQVIIPINLTNGCVFYRLMYTP